MQSYTATQTHGRADAQIRTYTDTQIRRHTDMRMHGYTDTLMLRYDKQIPAVTFGSKSLRFISCDNLLSRTFLTSFSPRWEKIWLDILVSWCGTVACVILIMFSGPWSILERTCFIVYLLSPVVCNSKHLCKKERSVFRGSSKKVQPSRCHRFRTKTS